MNTLNAKRKNTFDSFNTIVVGGGAGGLYFGAASPAHGRVLILEKTKKTGMKLLMAGSGQCNVTHGGSIKEFLLCYGDKGSKIRSLLYKYNNLYLCDFLQRLGVPLMEREDGKIFPSSMKASDVLNGLLRACEKKGVTIETDAEVTSVLSAENVFRVTLANGREYSCSNLVISTGGASYPTTGSDGSFYTVMARDLSISIVKPRPALVPVYVENYPFSDLSGISFSNISMTVHPSKKENKTKKFSASGDLLLTHKCLSGPLILNNSRGISTGDRLEINFLFPYNESDIISHLKENFPGNHKLISTFIGEEYLLPKRFIMKILALTKIADKKLASISGKEIREISQALTKLSFSVSGTGGFKEAMVTAGGVDLKEVNLTTMESKTHPNLYFVGEVLDIDGDTGGYNLQFAFSSAMAAVSNIFKERYF